MSGFEKLYEIFNTSATVVFDDTSRIVLLSDCHRGDGTWADDFSKNESIYYAALEHYYGKNFTYIEIGDGDELWENSRLSVIFRVDKDVFSLLSKFLDDGRLYMIFGNHDIVKKNHQMHKKNLCRDHDRSIKECTVFYDSIRFHEGLVLKHSENGGEIFLVHGHQVDFLNSTLWKLANFLVKHLWRPLELFGVNDPTSAANNYRKKERVEKKLMYWSARQNRMLIAGHTHRPVFPETGEPRYFNDGSCVHPNCITAIEIADGNIALVKWCVKAGPGGVLYIGKEYLAGPAELNGYLSGTSSKPIMKIKNISI